MEYLIAGFLYVCGIYFGWKLRDLQGDKRKKKKRKFIRRGDPFGPM